MRRSRPHLVGLRLSPNELAEVLDGKPPGMSARSYILFRIRMGRLMARGLAQEQASREAVN